MKQTAVINTPHGLMRVSEADGVVIELVFIKDVVEINNGEPTPLLKVVALQLEEYFLGKRKYFDLPLSITRGTEFQESVWQKLREIPYGETRTYGQIAQMIGNAKAARAVGMANNKNQLAILTPCHRVIGASGKLVGYAAGLIIKEQLLALEKNFTS